jgi:Cytochrome C oxidase, cbb3-type, subunit III
MKTLGKMLLVLFVLVLILLVFGISLTIGWRPFIGPRARPLTSRKFEATPQRLERGKYLFNSTAACVDCHSEHNWSGPEREIISDMQGSGEVMPISDLPGRVVAPNLTPDIATGVGSWTDDQLARAIREGVGYSGQALFPMMPYERYKHMSDEDLASIVVYMRSLPAIHHELPKTKIIFPVKYLIRTAPEPVTAPVAAPDPRDPVQWGA